MWCSSYITTFNLKFISYRSSRAGRLAVAQLASHLACFFISPEFPIPPFFFHLSYINCTVTIPCLTRPHTCACMHSVCYTRIGRIISYYCSMLSSVEWFMYMGTGFGGKNETLTECVGAQRKCEIGPH